MRQGKFSIAAAFVAGLALGTALAGASIAQTDERTIRDLPQLTAAPQSIGAYIRDNCVAMVNNADKILPPSDTGVVNLPGVTGKPISCRT